MHIALARAFANHPFQSCHCPAWPRKSSQDIWPVAFDEMNGPNTASSARPTLNSPRLAQGDAAGRPWNIAVRRRNYCSAGSASTFCGLWRRPRPQERLIPFDVIPRIMSAKEWGILEKGLKQRVSRASTCFLRDIYQRPAISCAPISFPTT